MEYGRSEAKQSKPALHPFTHGIPVILDNSAQTKCRSIGMFSFQTKGPEILWSHVMYVGGKTQAARRRREEERSGSFPGISISKDCGKSMHQLMLV